MNKKSIIGIISFIMVVMMIGITGCGKKETDSAISETASEVKVEYEEKGNIFLLTRNTMHGDEYVDGESILNEEEHANYSNPVWKKITITDEITLYDRFKYSVGYTKKNFEAILIQAYGEWTYIDVCGGADTSYAVRTDELNKVMVDTGETAIAIETQEQTEDTESKAEAPTQLVQSKPDNSNNSSNNNNSDSEDNNKKPSDNQTSQKKTCTYKEMVEMLKKAFKEQGFMDCPDYEELCISVTDTLYLSPEFSYENAQQWAKTYKNRGFNLCWIEYVRTNNDGKYAIKIYRGVRPDYIRTPEEVIKMLEDAYKEAGCIKSTDRMTPEDIEKYGPQDGMGWGLAHIEPDFTYEDALEDAKKSLKMGYNVYYFEYVETHMTGTVVIKGYRGSDN